MYHTPASTGEIPMYLPSEFIDQIDKLGIVGGGGMPNRLKTFVRDGLLYLSWEPSDQTVKEFEISFEPFDENDAGYTAIITSEYKRDFPRSIKQKGSCTEKLIDDIIIGMKYLFRVRALNVAGWGVWSYPAIGKLDNFPLEIGYTGEIVTLVIPLDGLYSIVAYGAKAADGNTRRGGRGAIIGAKFQLNK